MTEVGSLVHIIGYVSSVVVFYDINCVGASSTVGYYMEEFSVIVSSLNQCCLALIFQRISSSSKIS